MSVEREKMTKIAKKRSKYMDKLIAYHEAGHAVMAYHKGGIFFGITIDENSQLQKIQADGVLVGFQWQDEKATREKQALVLLAGLSAVAILQGCPDEYREDRNQSDIGKYFKLWAAKKLAQDNWPRFYLEGVEFLSKPTVWKQVEIVASTLLKKRLLSYDEVQLCIESVVDKKRKNDFEVYLKLTDNARRYREPN